MSSTSLPQTMAGVVLTGHGGLERLEYRTDLPVPRPGPEEVLVRVGGTALNNTDVNTRTGWYSKSDDGGSWAGEPLRFPLIQGADAAGRIAAVGAAVDAGRVGERVLVRPMQTAQHGDDGRTLVTMGSEFDGAFAQYVAVHHREAFPIDSPLDDVELASFPCASSTAEGMLHKAGVASGERVLVTGASGGVGSALIQLARRRGASVVAVASAAKADAVREIGAEVVLDRDDDPVEALGAGAVDVVADLVGGDGFGRLLDVVAHGGRYVTSGAIAGPIVDLDLRTLYLRDLTLLGSTYQPRQVFEDLVGHLERGELRPLIAARYPLEELPAAQERFLRKDFVGKIVIDVP